MDGASLATTRSSRDSYLPALLGDEVRPRLPRAARSDVLQLPDGSILISDDRGGRLIRVSYRR